MNNDKDHENINNDLPFWIKELLRIYNEIKEKKEKKKQVNPAY